MGAEEYERSTLDHIELDYPDGLILDLHFGDHREDRFRGIQILQLTDSSRQVVWEQQGGPHTSTLLPNGKVLIAGRKSERRYFTSTELYDPRTGDFTLSSSLGGSRSSHAAASTEDNRVLLVGGGGPRFITRGAQLYYTSIGDITRTSDMIHARIRPTAT